MTIRRKLVAILVVPLVALVALALVGMRDRNAESATARSVQRSVVLANAVSSLADSLEQEMIGSAKVIGAGSGASADQLTSQYVATDAAIATFDHLAPTGGGGTVASAVEQVRRSLDTLAQTRRTVQAHGEQGLNTLTVYQGAITRTLEVNNQISVAVSGSEAASPMAAYSALGRAKAARANEFSLLTLRSTGAKLDDQARAQLASYQADSATQGEVFAALADPAAPLPLGHLRSGRRRSRCDPTAGGGQRPGCRRSGASHQRHRGPVGTAGARGVPGPGDRGDRSESGQHGLERDPGLHGPGRRSDRVRPAQRLDVRAVDHPADP
jgi:hypothetical protein